MKPEEKEIILNLDHFAVGLVLGIVIGAGITVIVIQAIITFLHNRQLMPKEPKLKVRG